MRLEVRGTSAGGGCVLSMAVLALPGDGAVDGRVGSKTPFEIPDQPRRVCEERVTGDVIRPEVHGDGSDRKAALTWASRHVVSAADSRALASFVGDAQVVALGHSAHTAREQIQLAQRMVEVLIRSQGFEVLALEASGPSCAACTSPTDSRVMGCSRRRPWGVTSQR